MCNYQLIDKGVVRVASKSLIVNSLVSSSSPVGIVVKLSDDVH